MTQAEVHPARLVRKLDELETHVAAVWSAAQSRRQQSRWRSPPPRGGDLTSGVKPAHRQAGVEPSTTRPGTGFWRKSGYGSEGPTTQSPMGIESEARRASLLERLTRLILRR